jgi:predicted RNase H-like nuclease (RuvC/YqgF family)
VATNISLTEETRIALAVYLSKQQERHQKRLEQKQSRQTDRTLMNYDIAKALATAERKSDNLKLVRYIERLKKISENLEQRVTSGRIPMYIKAKDNANIDAAVKHIDKAIKALQLIK